MKNMSLTEFINNLNDKVETLVVIGERSHWIFNNTDEIEGSWADFFEVVEVVSERVTSMIVKVKCVF